MNGKTAEIGAGSISCGNDACAQPIAVANTASQSHSALLYSTVNMAWRLFDDKLVNSVRNYPVLYNTRLKDFRNSAQKENAWRAVAEEVASDGKS